ncbi:phage tail protein [Mesorhizobium japonicum]|uniref:Mlr6565 protein n=1 Tax=Mesorhizobium japonicum (strain LMG 29417 / CECT 9101 / MAFF 303099) TaxID=266835 RepID=Q988W5_RHILO|nr:phage tail protein [Mesorhizobium japonicum]BAB52832.1 mlr6565 [Mesorhizobium japonicum MAFF 303099]
MSKNLPLAYRFATEAQWQCCLFVGVDRTTAPRIGLRPYSPYQPSILFSSPGAHAPAITHAGEVVWRDNEGRLQRLAYGDSRPREVAAPAEIAHAGRLVPTSTALWAAGDGLAAFDIDSLTRLFVVDLGSRPIIDIAGDGREGIFVLVTGDCPREILHIDCTGRLTGQFQLGGAGDATAFTYLARSERFVVLASDNAKLFWFDVGESAAVFSLPIAAARPCLRVRALGSDGRSRLFLAGTDGSAFGGHHNLIMLDGDGNLSGSVEIAQSPTGVTAAAAQVYVATDGGMMRLDQAVTIPRSSVEVRSATMTPMLTLPATSAEQPWTRIETSVALPEGCTLEISYVSAKDPTIANEAQRQPIDDSLPQSRRIERMRELLGPWRKFAFHGAGAGTVTLTAPLIDVRDPFLWVQLELIMSPGAGIPALSEFSVFYSGQTLIDNLPAIYRRSEEGSGDFLRSFVGVLEATTQTLDSSIFALGSRIHPDTSPGEWLDFVARWLGIPWDDALSPEQKQRIVKRAADIIAGYGTRAGLEVLLECLLPEKPRRFRVTDMTVDFGVAMLGGDSCAGSRLPAILAGLPRTATELGNKAILGCARLPCPDVPNGAMHHIGRIRIDIGATAEESAAWQPWFGELINSMLPVATRAHLRWVSPLAFSRTFTLDGEYTLDAEPLAHLGTDAVAGATRLAGRRSGMLSRHGANQTIR